MHLGLYHNLYFLLTALLETTDLFSSPYFEIQGCVFTQYAWHSTLSYYAF